MNGPSRKRLSLSILTIFLTGCIEAVPTAKPNASSASQSIELTPLQEFMTDSSVAMLVVPAGVFQMGNSEGADDEQPAHEVNVSGFLMDKHEVTQDLFARLELPNPSHFKGDKRPVEQIRWSDAAIVCNERSRAEGREPCYDEATFACNFEANGYRLPTEAEWEYAARCGGGLIGEPNGTTATKALEQTACYAGTSAKQTQAVGQRRANPWGFVDLQGNVAEWCNDIYAADYYAASPSHDPQGPTTGAKRVLRGGHWKSTADGCRLTARIADDPGISDACFARDTFGFRCVRRAE